MHKNVWRGIMLPLFVIIFLASCSSNKKYSSHYSKRKANKERTTVKSRDRIKKSSRSYSAKSPKRSSIVKTAKKYIGQPYVYGGKKPSSGFDCSGFTSYVFNENGVSVDGPSYQQAKKGKRKSMGSLKEGDLVFFGSKNKVSHVAIVANVSKDKLEVIHSTSSRGVVIDDISSSEYWQKRYLFGRDVLN